MSLARREDLVRVAREFDALIITDDVYDFLQWPATDPRKENLEKAVQPRIVDVDRNLDGGTSRNGADGFGNSFSNGSFSKIVGPGVRCGWVEGSETFAFALSQVYGHSSMWDSKCITDAKIAARRNLEDHHLSLSLRS